MSNAVIQPVEVVRVRRGRCRPRPGCRPVQPEVGSRGWRRAVVHDGTPVACVMRRPSRLMWLRLKKVMFAVLTALGFLVAAPQLLAMGGPDPAVDPVAGDPAWAHVIDD